MPQPQCNVQRDATLHICWSLVDARTELDHCQHTGVKGMITFIGVTTLAFLQLRSSIVCLLQRYDMRAVEDNQGHMLLLGLYLAFCGPKSTTASSSTKSSVSPTLVIHRLQHSPEFVAGIRQPRVAQQVQTLATLESKIKMSLHKLSRLRLSCYRTHAWTVESVA